MYIKRKNIYIYIPQGYDVLTKTGESIVWYRLGDWFLGDRISLLLYIMSEKNQFFSPE